MTTMTKWVEWEEPFDSKYRYHVVMRMRVEDVALYQRQYAMEVHGHQYESDEAAVDDFVTIRWGWIKEYEE